MPVDHGSGDEITGRAFADYVHDIAGQLAKSAETFEMHDLAAALHDACEEAVLERNRRARMDGAS